MKTQQRDGALVVVDRKLGYAIAVPHIAATLQTALDHWADVCVDLAAVSTLLNTTPPSEAFLFDPRQCEAPLPRAYQWVDASAYVNHVELVRKARGVEMPDSFWQEPLVYQGGSDDFIGPYDDVVVPSEAFGIDLEGETAIIVDDVAMGTSARDAARHIKLVMLVNDVSLRHLIPAELSKGFGFFQGKPATAFAPIAITPDELGAAWRDGTIHRPLNVSVNDKPIGAPLCGEDMTFNFNQLIAHAAKTRNLGAGTIIGSGTISNYDRSRGSACIAELRMLETLESGAPRSPFLRDGDKVRIEMFDDDGASIFGAIDHTVTCPK